MGEFHKATLGEKEREATADTQNLDLMMKQQQLRQKLAGSAMLQNLGGPQGGAPQAGGTTLGGLTVPSGGAPTGMPAGVGGIPPVGGAPMPQSRPGLPTSVTGFAPIGRRELVAGQQIGDPETEKFLFNLQKAEVESKKAADAGFTEITIPETDKKVRVRVEVSDAYYELGREVAITGDEQKLIRFMVANKMIPAIGRKTNAQGQVEYEKPKTALEEAQERERLTQTEKTRAESSEKSAEQLKNRASVAFDNTQTANDMISYVKSNPEVFRLLNTGSARDVVLRAMGAGIQTPSGSISLPVNELKKMGLRDEQIDTLQMFAQSAAQLNIQFRKTMQGQGQITEKESQLAAELGAMASDSDVVIRLKSELLIERSKFDDKSYGQWLEYRDTGKSYDQYLHSAEYKALKADYSDTLKNIREANADLLKKKPKPTAAPASPNARPPATALPSNDPSVPPGYIRDPQTQVIRKKREWE
jgi:hypothetical protein